MPYSVFFEHPDETIRRDSFAKFRTTGNQEVLVALPDAAAIQFSKKWKVNFRIWFKLVIVIFWQAQYAVVSIQTLEAQGMRRMMMFAGYQLNGSSRKSERRARRRRK